MSLLYLFYEQLCCVGNNLHLFYNNFVGVSYIIYENDLFQQHNLVRSNEIDNPAASLKEIRIKFNTVKKEGTVQLAKELNFDWTTACHMCIIQALEDVAELKSKISKKEIIFLSEKRMFFMSNYSL